MFVKTRQRTILLLLSISLLLPLVACGTTTSPNMTTESTGDQSSSSSADTATDTPPPAVDNPTMYSMGTHKIAVLDEAVFILADAFLYTVPEPIASSRPSLLSTDTRSATRIASEPDELWKNTAFFNEARNVFTYGDELLVVHRDYGNLDPEKLTFLGQWIVSAISANGTNRRVLAELPGAEGFAVMSGDRLFYTARDHDEENRARSVIRAVDLRSKEDSEIAEIPPPEIDGRLSRRDVQGFVVYEDTVLLTIDNLYRDADNLEQLNVSHYLLDLGSGQIHAFRPQIELEGSQSITYVQLHQQGILFNISEGRDKDTTTWYLAAHDGSDVKEIYTSNAGEQVLSDGCQFWLVPTAAGLIAQLSTREEAREELANCQNAGLSIRHLDLETGQVQTVIEEPSDPYKDFFLAFIHADQRFYVYSINESIFYYGELPDGGAPARELQFVFRLDDGRQR